MRIRVLFPVLLAATLACGPDGSDRSPAAGPAGSAIDAGQVRSFDGLPIAYRSRGSGAGALLFIHGWEGSQGQWTAQADAFSEAFRVLTIDLAGHGESGRDRSEWTIEALGLDVATVIEALDLRAVVLIGHSIGGSVALEAARRLPARVVGVIGVDAFYSAEFRDTPELPAVLPDYDLAGSLSAAPVPVRALNGDRWPTDIGANRAHHPDFDARIIEATGHLPMLERPDEFNRVLAEIVEELTAGRTN